MKMIITIIFFFTLNSQNIWAVEKLKYEMVDVKTTVDGYTYEASVYTPKNLTIKSIVIISPTIVGVMALERASAIFFAKAGYLAIIPHPFETELTNSWPDVKKLDLDYLRPVPSVKNFLGLVEKKFKLSSELPVFALGSSQGAITSLLLTSQIPRIKAAWVAVPGGDLPHIFARSIVKELVTFRENHMNALKMSSIDKYEDYLRANLTNDPIINCKDIRVPFHQTVAKHDLSVPTVTQELLVDECPAHQVKRMNVSHSGGAMSVVNDRKEILEFFEDSI